MILSSTIALYLNTSVSKVQEIPVYQARERENDITSKIYPLRREESTPFSLLFTVIEYALSYGLGQRSPFLPPGHQSLIILNTCPRNLGLISEDSMTKR